YIVMSRHFGARPTRSTILPRRKPRAIPSRCRRALPTPRWAAWGTTSRVREPPMNVLVFGATGMIGQGVVGECIKDPAVRRIVVVGRQPTDRVSDKLHEIVQTDVADLLPIQSELRDIDACFFCLGV